MTISSADDAVALRASWPWSYLLREARQFVRGNSFLAVALALGLLLSFGLSLTSFSLSIDEEVHLIADQNGAWMRQGRFAITLEKWLFNALYPLPFLNIALSLILIFLSAIMWMALFERVSRGQLRSSPAAVLAALFYATIPVNSYFMSFNTYNVEVSLGLLLAALAVRCAWAWAIESGGWAYLVSSFACAMLAAGTYQSLLVVSAIGLIITQAIDLITAPQEQPPRFRIGPVRNLRAFIPLIGGAAIAMGLSRFVLPSDGYTDNFVAWGKADPRMLTEALWAHIHDILTGGSFPGGEVIAVTVWAGCLVLVVALFRAIGSRDWTVPILVLALFAMPFAMSVALGTPLPFRAQQALPLSFAGFWVLLYLIVPFRAVVRAITLILIVPLIVWNAQANTRLSFAELIASERDRILGHRIAGELNAVGWDGSPIPLVFVGAPAAPHDRFSVPSETIGRSLFNWDHGTRAIVLMDVLGYSIDGPSKDQITAATETASAMPLWPLPGSVAIHDGVAIVNFGPPQ